MNEDGGFLRNIACAPGDDLPRLVYADWLDERGDVARAEFIRAQCELAHSGLSEDRRRALHSRERSLIDTHRHGWIEAFGVPADDVRFARGLLSELRLPEWDGGKLLAAAIAPRLSTLEELDLAGLDIGDAGLEEFARRADFPALRKIRLNGNGITDAGAIALASANGLPRLASAYLFDNRVGGAGRAALEGSSHFRLTDLDLGEPAVGYRFTPGQADAARRRFLREYLWPCVLKYFRKYDRLQSAMLCVAQYWADEADDAVHDTLIVSELPEPTLVGARTGYEEESVSDPNVPNTRIGREYGGWGSAVDTPGVPWDDNSGAIPLWAAFASEGGSQEYGDLAESYSPAVMFHRHGGHEILPMPRPHLDGILPEWH